MPNRHSSYETTDIPKYQLLPVAGRKWAWRSLIVSNNCYNWIKWTICLVSHIQENRDDKLGCARVKLLVELDGWLSLGWWVNNLEMVDEHKMFTSQKIWVQKSLFEKKFISKQSFGSKDFGLTKFWVQKIYRVPKNFGQTNFWYENILSKLLRLAKNWVPNVWSKLGQ